MGRQYRGGSGKRYTGEDSAHKGAEDVNDSLAQYYFDLYHSGIKISERGLSILQQRGFIESPKRHEPAKPTSLGDTVEYDYKYFGIDPKLPVKKKQWIAHNGNPLQPNDEFVLWVDSQFHGMSRAIKNKQFELYKLQAKQWLEDDDKISNHITRDEKIRFLLKERNRCMNNSLYGLNKYLWMKEGEVTQGKLKYEAWECQAAVLWVMDCGFSSFTGKLRQVGLTTTILGRAEMRARLRRNYFIKFITENVKKAEEIFEDKLKYAYSEQPEWFKTTVHNDAPQVFKYMFKDKKGSMKGSNSRVQVEAPYTTAINGGSPNEVIVDESGNINILSSMLNEGRPAMFWINPNTGVWEMRRQVTSFGCVCAGTKVWDSLGNLVNIEDLKQEDGILGYDNGISIETIPWMQPPAYKECYRITTNRKRRLECSFDHPILYSKPGKGVTPRKFGRKFFKHIEFKETHELKVGDQIAVIEEVPIWGNKKMWQPRLVGWLIGDGSYGYDNTPRLSNCDFEILNYVESNFKTSLNDSYITKDGKQYKELRINGICPNLRELGIYGQTKDNKRLPINHHSYSKEDICELIGGYFDSDGCVHNRDDAPYIDLNSCNLELLQELRLLLQKLGIHCTLIDIKYKKGEGSKSVRDGFRIVISDTKSLRKFYENINLYVGYKQERLEWIINKISKRIGKLSNTINGLRFEKIVSIEKIGFQKIYNLTAGNSHTYIANGIVTHNTAGDMKKGDGQFEAEFRAAVEKWKERDFSYGFVPIFIDAFAKPGITKERYEEEKSNYYAKAKNRVDGEKLRIQFHQHYPITIDDMFLQSSNTLIPLIEINDNIEKIWNLPAERQIQYGEMVPIFDTSCPTPDLYTPYKIIGASFKPLRIGDPNITVIMFMPPQDGWKNRYFQGTDPISSSTGNSDMVAAIWDSHLNIVPSVMKFRGRDHKYCFLQSMLLGLFYSKDIKDLCEGNIGQDYIDFKEYHGYKSTLLHNNRLPKYLQVTTSGIGIRKLTHNAPYILTKTREIAEHYSDGIFIEPFWSQLKTYVEKVNDKGYTSYATQNAQIYRDDVIDAVTYAFINAECHSNNPPSSIYDAPKLKKPKMKYVLTDDGRLTLKRM